MPFQFMLRVLAVIATVIGFSATAVAQAGGGDTRAFAQCVGESARAPAVGDDFTLSAAGVCVSQQPGFGGVGSVNSASAHTVLLPWRLFIDNSAVCDFRGAGDASASASTYASFGVTANDVVFTSISDPFQVGSITQTMNFMFRSRCSSQGVSNCFSGYPVCYDYYNIYIDGAGRAGGDFAIDPGSGPSAHNDMVGYPNDASTAYRTTREASANLRVPQSVNIGVVASNALGYCAGSPGQVGGSSALLEVSLPCGTPVFNLPDGITVNSAQLGIVNNIRSGVIITQQPVSQTTCSPEAAVFSVTATGSSLTYSWRKGGVPIDPNSNSSAVTPTLLLSDVSPADAGSYDCVVVGGCDTVISTVATLTVQTMPGDINGDHRVDLSDLAILLSAYGHTGPLPADLNGDGAVDLSDLAILLSAYGTTCP